MNIYVCRCNNMCSSSALVRICTYVSVKLPMPIVTINYVYLHNCDLICKNPTYIIADLIFQEIPFLNIHYK